MEEQVQWRAWYTALTWTGSCSRCHLRWLINRSVWFISSHPQAWKQGILSNRKNPWSPKSRQDFSHARARETMRGETIVTSNSVKHEVIKLQAKHWSHATSVFHYKLRFAFISVIYWVSILFHEIQQQIKLHFRHWVTHERTINQAVNNIISFPPAALQI